MTQHIPLGKYDDVESLLDDWSDYMLKNYVEQECRFSNLCPLRERFGCFGGNYVQRSLLHGLISGSSILDHLCRVLKKSDDVQVHCLILHCLVNLSLCPSTAEWFVNSPSEFFPYLKVTRDPSRLREKMQSRHYVDRIVQTMWLARHLATDRPELIGRYSQFGILDCADVIISALHDTKNSDFLCEFMWACKSFLCKCDPNSEAVVRMIAPLAKILESYEGRPLVAAGALGLLALIINQDGCRFELVLAEVPHLFGLCIQLSRCSNKKIKTRLAQLFLSVSSHSEASLLPWYESGIIALLGGFLTFCTMKNEETVLWAISNFLVSDHRTIRNGTFISGILGSTISIAISRGVPKSTLEQCIFVLHSAVSYSDSLIEFLVSEGVRDVLHNSIPLFRDDEKMLRILCEILCTIVADEYPRRNDSLWKSTFLLLPHLESNRFWYYLRHLLIEGSTQELPTIEKLSLNDPSAKRLPDMASLSLNDE